MNRVYDVKSSSKRARSVILVVLFVFQANVSLIPDQAERSQHKFTAPTLLLKVKPETQVVGGFNIFNFLKKFFFTGFFINSIQTYNLFYVHIMYACMYIGFVPEINLFIFVLTL